MSQSKNLNESREEHGRKCAEFMVTIPTSSPQRIETFVLDEHPDKPGKGEFVKALWDTGASGTIIHKDLADRLGLVPCGRCRCQSSRDEKVIDLSKAIVMTRLCEHSVTVGIDDLCGEDIIIGMDIILDYDFHITHDTDGNPVCIISEI